MPSRSIIVGDTSTALAAAGTYTSGWVQVYAWDLDDANIAAIPVTHDKLRLLGQAYADVASAVGGLIIQQSYDASTVLHSDTITVLAATSETFDIAVWMKYIRVFYTNGAVAQTTFRLIARLVEDA